MDFHTLTRKELQFLCKKNKIPANITNVAMADALTAIENVAGLDELINQSQSPEEIAPESESPLITRNVNRTSTRRKPVNEDPETAEPLTRTRRTITRRTIDKDLDQEKNNLNVSETPAVPASRRRAPASKKMDTRKKETVEHEISSNSYGTTPVVRTNRKRTQVASARRKVEEGSVQRVYGTRQSLRFLEKTMADLSLKDKGRAEPVKMNDLDETEETYVSAASFEKTTDSKVSSSIESLEEMKDDVQQQNKSDENSVDDQEADTQNSGCLDNHLVEVNAKDDDVHDEASVLMLSDKSNKSNADEMESVAVPVTDFPSETENAFAEVVEQEYCLMNTDEISAKVMKDDVPDHVEAYQKDFIPFGSQLKSENDSELLLDFKNTQPQSTAADESPSDTNVDVDSGSQKSVGDQLDTNAAECVEKEMIIFENEIDEELIDVSLIEAEVPISNKGETPEFVKQISHSSPLASEETIPLSIMAVDSISEGKPPGYVEYPYSRMKNLVDVYVMLAEEFAEEFGKNPTPGKHSVSGGKFTCIKSPLGADPLSTPISKKKQATNEKIILVADNKENIDSSGMKVVNKKIVDEGIMLKSQLEDKSLRQLTKMLKEKLQINSINNKINNEEENIQQQQVGKTRPALQTLPVNLMLIPGEQKSEN